MKMTSMHSARLLGALALLATFVAGWLASAVWSHRPADAVSVNVRMSTRLPPELTSLGLSATQTDSVRLILANGNRTVNGILRDFDPRIRTAVDSVEAQIRSVLTPSQRARFHPRSQRREERSVELDTTTR